MNRIDLRNKMSQIGDQGKRPTCVAYALTACHEYYYNSSPKELSKDSLHWGCICQDGPAFKGVSPETAMNVLKFKGQHLEQAWPYRPDLDEGPWEALQPPEVDGQIAFKITGTMRFEIKDPDNLDELLRKNGPLFITIPIWSSFYSIKKGIIPLPDELIEELRGHHAVCIVGLTDENNIIIRNSWGPKWGFSGYALMPFQYLKKYVSCVTLLIVKLEE